MIRLILFIIILATMSIASVWLADHNGVISIDWLGYHIETTILFATIIFSILFFVLLTLAEWRFSSRADRVLSALTKGFAAIAVSDIKKAKSASVQVTRLLKKHQSNMPIAHILAAQTAQLEGKADEANVHFSALLENKQTKFAALKGLLVNACQEKDLTQAINYAEQAYKMNAKAGGIAPALLLLYKQAGMWEKAYSFLKSYNRGAILSFSSKGDEFDVNQEKSTIAYLLSLKFYKDGDVKNATNIIYTANKLNPAFIPAALFAVEIANKIGNKRKSLSIIEKTWKYSPHPELAKVYVLDLEGKALLKKACKLMKINPTSSDSRKLVAEAYLALGNVEKSRETLLPALEDKETASLCRLMVEIEKSSDEVNKREVERWAVRAEYASPDSVWLCRKCGNTSPDWDIECGSCDAVDTIGWDYPTSNDFENPKEINLKFEDYLISSS